MKRTDCAPARFNGLSFSARGVACKSKVDLIMGRKIQVCALSLLGAFGYTTAAFAQTAEAPKPAAEAAATTTTTTTTTTATTEPAAAAPAPADAPPAAPAAAPAEPAPAAAPPAPPPAPPNVFESLKIESKNGSATLKVGLLLQPQYEALGSPDAAHEGTSNNLFIRRTRLLVGGTLFKTFEYFFDTDAPNLFRGSTDPTPPAGMGMPNGPATGTKGGTGIVVQDAFATWKAYEDMIKFDVGYMLTPGAHNALQGAGTLLGLDYFANSFNHSNQFNGGAPVGRDAGVEVRGLLLDNHIEYRAGLFQGLRKPGTNPTMTDATGDVAAQNMFRFAGRIQVNLLDAETGFFYAGTYLGKKKIVSVGAALDMQSDYKHWAVDGFADLPLGPGTLTAQVNFSKWNGGGFTVNTFPTPVLVNQTAIMAEAGFRLDAFPIAPIVKFEQQNIADSDAANTRIGGGLAYFPYGHNINLKAFYTNINAKPAVGDSRSYNQFQLQWQLYFY